MCAAAAAPASVRKLAFSRPAGGASPSWERLPARVGQSAHVGYSARGIFLFLRVVESGENAIFNVQMIKNMKYLYNYI